MSIKSAMEILGTIPLDRPGPVEAPTEDDLAPWRDRIDAIDAAVVCLLNERSRCANSIGRIKKLIGQPVYVPSRENEVVENATMNNTGPLTDRAIRRLFERIIDETRSLERHLYQEDDSQITDGDRSDD